MSSPPIHLRDDGPGDVDVPHAPPADVVRIREIDPFVRHVVARAGIDAGAWVIARSLERCAVISPHGHVPLRPAAVLEVVHDVRSTSPRPRAVAAAAVEAMSACGVAGTADVAQGEVTVAFALPARIEVGATLSIDCAPRAVMPLPSAADGALRSGAADAGVRAEAALREAFVGVRAVLDSECAAFAPDVGAYLATLEADAVASFVPALRAAVEAIVPWRPGRRDAGPRLGKALRHAFDAVLTAHAATLASARFKRSVGLHDYVNLHRVARSLGRRLTLIVGPTNSGKTWEALAIARAAPTSRILSPLRLLAMEHYEALVAAGLDAAMLTGEERVGPADAPHVAQTIETLDVREVVDVAVVDEVQMLLDRQRGWAWTEAVVGVPARHVVMTGSLDCVELVGRIARMTGERLEVRRLVRKNPLVADERPVALSEVAPGDAVVAFSRAAVFEMRELLTRRGLSVASVYGALSPEVRRAESRRFREGDADVLVATDAIGMGLNIGTLKRVVFSTLRKYDGVAERGLEDSEMRQIAGRAGRFGFAEEGRAAVLAGGGSPMRLVAALGSKGRQLSADRLLVRPSHAVIRAAAREHPGDDVVALVRRVADMLADDEQVEVAELEETLEVAGLVKGSGLSVEDCWTYACSPLDRRSFTARRLLAAWARDHAAGREVRLPEFESGALLDFEGYGRIATLYLWLSRRFPAVFVGADAAETYRRANDRRIEAELLAGATARAVRREGAAHSRRRGRRS